MISTLKVYQAKGHNPYENIALEKHLFDQVGPQELILYLWVNEPSVIIGRNQNPYKECNLSVMKEDGVKLARRLSGGGAVFHDYGNLNFTFIAREENMDIKANLQVIRSACQSFGLDVQISGRNDLTIDGFKFSGNAFLNAAGHSYHHGTIMINVESSRLENYLNVDAKKLEAKGLSSVRSRVKNLQELNHDITVEGMITALRHSFARAYQLEAVEVAIPERDTSSVLPEMINHFSSPDWIMGPKAQGQFRIHQRFAWGDFDLNFNVKEGLMSDLNIFSDALSQDLAPAIAAELEGCAADYEAIADRLKKIATDLSYKSMATDILELIKENI